MKLSLVPLITCGIILGTALFPTTIFAERPTITVGATLALTGSFAFLGEAERNGLILGIETVNANPRRKVSLRLVTEDNHGDPKLAVGTVQKLLDVDEADVIYSAFTHITRALAPIVSRAGKILIYASSLSGIARDFPLVFHDYFDLEEDGRLLARAVGKRGKRFVVYLREDGEACQSHERAFVEAAKEHALTILRREEFPAGIADLKPLLLRVHKLSPQALVICAWRDDYVLMRQLKELGLVTLPTFHALLPFMPVADSIEMRKIYEENGAISTWYGGPPEARNEAQAEFRKAYQARFGNEPLPDAAYAYDDMTALAKALEPCVHDWEVDQACTANRLLKTKLEGAGGLLQFDAQRVSTRPLHLIQVQAGNWKEFPVHDDGQR